MGEGKEWGLLATVFRAAREVRQSLIEIEGRGRPKIPGPLATRPNGQVLVPVFSKGSFDRLLFSRVTGVVGMEAGVTVDAECS